MCIRKGQLPWSQADRTGHESPGEDCGRPRPVLALTVKIRKSQDFLAPISGSPGDQIFSLTFRNFTSIFLNIHLWSKIAILKLNNT